MLLGIILNHVEGLKHRLPYPFVPKWDEICCNKYAYDDEQLIPIFHMQPFLYHYLLDRHPCCGMKPTLASLAKSNFQKQFLLLFKSVFQNLAHPVQNIKNFRILHLYHDPNSILSSRDDVVLLH